MEVTQAAHEFDAISDRATYAEPHQLAIGIRHVFVNGTQVLRDAEHTGAMPGQVVRGPGWAGYEVSTPGPR